MIFLFDLDSTLSTAESLDELAKHKGVGRECAALTKAAMDGELPVSQVFVRKLGLMQINPADIEYLVATTLDHISTKNRTLIHELREAGDRCGIVSQNLQPVVRRVGQELGCDTTLLYGTLVVIDEKMNTLTFDSHQIILQPQGKTHIVEKVKKNNPHTKVAFIGDGVYDLQTAHAADVFVGYGGIVEREYVKTHAKHYVYHLDEAIDLARKLLK